MLKQLSFFAEDKPELPQDAHIVVSISGGKDSVATLLGKWIMNNVCQRHLERLLRA